MTSPMILRFMRLASILAFLLAACTAQNGNGSIANRQTQVTVYTALEQEEIDAYLPDFELAYPDIQINLVRQSAGELTARILAERDDPQADVLWGVPLTNIFFFEWNELLKPYPPLGLERVDRRFRDARQPPYWVGNGVMITAFCVNSQLMNRKGLPIPKTWKDLLDPTYRRSIIMPSPTTSSTGLTAVLSILRIYGEIDGWKYLDSLHKNITLYTLSGTAPCELVQQGEYPIAIARHFEGMNNLRFVYPSDSLGSEVVANALVRKETIPPSARTFLDWAISDSAMRLYARKSAVTGVKTGLAIPDGFPANPEALLFKGYKKDVPWTAANRDRILLEWQKRYGHKVR